jgi:hypothetical protein
MLSESPNPTVLVVTPSCVVPLRRQNKCPLCSNITITQEKAMKSDFDLGLKSKQYKVKPKKATQFLNKEQSSQCLMDVPLITNGDTQMAGTKCEPQGIEWNIHSFMD